MAADNHFCIFRFVCCINCVRQFNERGLVNNSVYKVREIFNSTNFYVGHILLYVVFYFGPNIGWNVGAWGGRTFLSLILECPRTMAVATSLGHAVGRRRYSPYLRFPQQFSDNFCIINVFHDSSPNIIEYLSWSGEMYTCKIFMRENNIGSRRAWTVNQVDNTVR